jgi:hypothetical protein
VPGIGPLTATALVASIGDAKNFDNGRQFAAWLGVVPRQHSSGGKPTLLGMSKRGDAYLRTMLIHGARSVIYRATQKADAELVGQAHDAPKQERSGGRNGEQDRSNRLGAAGARPRVQLRLRCSLIARQTTPTEKENPTADCSGN